MLLAACNYYQLQRTSRHVQKCDKKNASERLAKVFFVNDYEWAS